MTVGQLKKILNNYSDDMTVKITYDCDNDFRAITTVRPIGKVDSFLSIETDSIPKIDDLIIMASETLEQYDSVLLDYEKELLRNLIGEE